MILGEVEYTGYKCGERWINPAKVVRQEDGVLLEHGSGEVATTVAVPESDVVKRGDTFVLVTDETIRIESRAHKMSKARGNVVNPDVVVKEYGADSLRLYEMFMGPLEATKPWSMAGVSGVRNFLDRVWRMIVDFRSDDPVMVESVREVEPTEEQNRMLHRTIASVTRDTATMSFNTAIARMMEFVNFFTKEEVRPRAAMSDFVLLLAPYAPHMAEELWQLLGNRDSLAYQPWPTYDEALTKTAEIEIPIQVNGKVRGRVMVPAEASQAEMERLAQLDPHILELLAGKQIVKVIVVPGRLVNIVVKG
jgi:leucyl-tRNA synthetase